MFCNYSPAECWHFTSLDSAFYKPAIRKFLVAVCWSCVQNFKCIVWEDENATTSPLLGDRMKLTRFCIAALWNCCRKTADGVCWTDGFCWKLVAFTINKRGYQKIFAIYQVLYVTIRGILFCYFRVYFPSSSCFRSLTDPSLYCARL